MGLIEKSSDIDRLVSTVKDTGGVYFVTAFSGLLAPYWDSEAGGLLIGISAYTTKAHVCRATLEAASFQVSGESNSRRVSFPPSLSPLRPTPLSSTVHPLHASSPDEPPSSCKPFDLVLTSFFLLFSRPSDSCDSRSHACRLRNRPQDATSRRRSDELGSLCADSRWFGRVHRRET